jgi:predicted nucleotide-binding protein
VPFHVYAFERYLHPQRGLLTTGQSYAFANLSEERLRERIITPWDEGRAVTYEGKTFDPMRSEITIFETEEPIDTGQGVNIYEQAEAAGHRVTNDWILGAAGRTRDIRTVGAAMDAHSVAVLRDRRRVMVVHGRNTQARDAMFIFLRAVGLEPIEWEEAIAETGEGSPHNLEAVRAAMDIAQAVVVVLTAEDRAGLLPELAPGGDDDDELLRGQPRQNVILEAGLAMGVDRSRVILVELGEIRRASDFDGLNVVRLTNQVASRHALRNRLRTAGCTIAEQAADWTRPEVAGDFETAVIAVAPRRPYFAE